MMRLIYLAQDILDGIRDTFAIMVETIADTLGPVVLALLVCAWFVGLVAALGR